MLDGVKDVSIDLQTRHVSVIYQPPLSTAAILAQLEAAGFEAEAAE